MEAPKVRLSEKVANFAEKLGRILEKDRSNVVKAFEAAVAESSNAEGVCDGLKLVGKLDQVLAACPEGPAHTACSDLVDRIREERSYRGELWCRDSLLPTLREGVAALGEKAAAPAKKGKDKDAE